MSFIARTGFQQIAQIFPKAIAPSGVRNAPSIITQISNLFKGFGSGAARVGGGLAKAKGTIAITAGSTAITALSLPLGQGGQTGLQSASQSIGSATKLGSDVTKFFSNNPIAAVGVIILGGLVVVSLVKK